MTNSINAAEPAVGSTAGELATDSRDPGLRKPVSGPTKKPAKSMAGTLTVDEANSLHHEFATIVWGIEHDIQSLDALFDLLFAADPVKEMELHYSGKVFRSIRVRVNALQARIRMVGELGHTPKEASNV